MGTVKVADIPKQGRGKTIKKVCPDCNEYYLVVAYIHQGTFKNQKWAKIGYYCSGCGYFEHEVTEESNGTDVVDEIENVTGEEKISKIVSPASTTRDENRAVSAAAHY